MDGQMDSFGLQQQQQRSSSSSGSGSVTCCCWHGQTQNVYLLHSLQYYRQVHNLLMFHNWFPCMLIIVRYSFAHDKQ